MADTITPMVFGDGATPGAKAPSGSAGGAIRPMSFGGPSAPVKTSAHDLPDRPAANTFARRKELAGAGRIDSGVGAFAHGAADTLTFGFLDEAGAWVDSTLPTWAGGTGESYEDALRKNRAILGLASEDYSKTFFTGQLVGGFVPAWGWVGRASGVARGASVASTGSRMFGVGAAYGAAYGLGSSEDEDLFTYNRFRDMAVGGAVGGVGGYVLGVGAQYVGNRVLARLNAGARQRIPESAIPAPTTGNKALPEGTPVKAPTKPARIAAAADDVVDNIAAKQDVPVNALTGKPVDELVEGAVVTSAELWSKRPGAAVAAAFARVSKLSPEQAKKMAESFAKGKADGSVVDDPHFRSLLGVEVGDELDDALRAASAIEEIEAIVRQRAGMGGKTTVAQVDAKLRAQYGDGISEAHLDEVVERYAGSSTDVNVAANMSMIAGLKYARAVETHLAEVLKGTEGALETLQDEIVTAIRIMAKANVIKSEAGRALGLLSQKKSLVFSEVRDGKIEIEDRATIAAKLKEALSNLDDTTLAETLSALRTVDDVERVQEILLSAEATKSLSATRRAMNSASIFIKSNLLTPATAAINIMSAVGHDFFRNSMARNWAITGFRAAGKETEALKLEFEKKIMDSAYWYAHRQGVSQMLKRIKWEWLDSKEKIAGVMSANSKAALNASTAKRAMLSDGYTPPPLRADMASSGRAAVTDVAGFNARMAEKYAGGGMAKFYEAVHRTGAGALNTLDAAGTAVGRITTGAMDDWGRSFVRLKEMNAYAARFAINEAMEMGLQGDDLFQYAGRRTTDLLNKPHADLLLEVEEALVRGRDLSSEQTFLMGLDRKATKEGDASLFNDGPQSTVARKFTTLASDVDALVSAPLSATAMLSKDVRSEVAKRGWPKVSGLLIPYIRTPMRIFERGLLSYTPWAKVADESRRIIERGGMEAAMEQARIEMGTMGIAVGAMLAASGAITLTNGGYKDTRNLDGSPPQRINLPGGAHVEMQRMDPLALTLALGGMVGQGINEYRHQTGSGYAANDAIESAVGIAVLAMREAVLEKSYLTGLRDLIKSASGDEGSSLLTEYQKVLTRAAVGVIPASGVMRQANDTMSGNAVEAISFIDQLYRVTPGLGLYLPARRDVLGDPIEGRTMGIAAGNSSVDDPVRKQLIDLGIDLQNLSKTETNGLRLTSEELSELRRIRGHEATDADGRTMREALGELFADTAFQRLPTIKQKKREVLDTLRPFNNAAREIYEQRNPQYSADRTGIAAFLSYMREDGYDTETAREAAQADVAAEGLPEATRLGQARL